MSKELGIGIGIGIAIGVVVALLVAPQPGEETRRYIKEKASRVRGRIRKGGQGGDSSI